MSVVVRTPEGKIVVLTKGAVSYSPKHSLYFRYLEYVVFSVNILFFHNFFFTQDNVIFERLAPDQDEIVATTLNHLRDFANEGKKRCFSF